MPDWVTATNFPWLPQLPWWVLVALGFAIGGWLGRVTKSKSKKK